MRFSIIGANPNGHPTKKKVNLDLYFTPFAKMNFRVITDFKCKIYIYKKIKLSEDNIKEYHNDFKACKDYRQEKYELQMK